MVYVALPTAELGRPARMPMALMVVLVATLIGPEYRADEPVGVEPSTVYRMLAPAVLVEIDTDWVLG
jgi:hypothetical protein